MPFKSKKQLEREERKKNATKIKCEKCSKEFTPNNIEKHKKALVSCVPAKTRVRLCQICYSVIPSDKFYQHFRNHYRLLQNDVAAYKRFLFKVSIKFNSEMIDCNICHNRYSKKQLTQHKRQVHGIRTPKVKKVSLLAALYQDLDEGRKTKGAEWCERKTKRIMQEQKKFMQRLNDWWQEHKLGRQEFIKNKKSQKQKQKERILAKRRLEQLKLERWEKENKLINERLNNFTIAQHENTYPPYLAPRLPSSLLYPKFENPFLLTTPKKIFKVLKPNTTSSSVSTVYTDNSSVSSFVLDDSCEVEKLQEKYEFSQRIAQFKNKIRERKAQEEEETATMQLDAEIPFISKTYSKYYYLFNKNSLYYLIHT